MGKELASQEMQDALMAISEAIDTAIRMGTDPVLIYGNVVDRAVSALIMAMIRGGAPVETRHRILREAVQNGLNDAAAKVAMAEKEQKKPRLN